MKVVYPEGRPIDPIRRSIDVTSDSAPDISADPDGDRNSSVSSQRRDSGPPSPAVVVSTTVQLPQYAYFFNPSNETCEPVIVLEADAVGNLVYSRPLAKTAGVAPVVFFDLLGGDPPIDARPD